MPGMKPYQLSSSADVHKSGKTQAPAVSERDAHYEYVRYHNYLHDLGVLEHEVTMSDPRDNTKFWESMWKLPLDGIRALFCDDLTATAWNLHDELVSRSPYLRDYDGRKSHFLCVSVDKCGLRSITTLADR